MLQVLSNYLPQAVEAEKQLARAIAQRKYGERASNAYSRAQMRRRAADQEHHSQFQYKLKLNDEFDAQGQHHLRRFVEDDDEEECKEGDEDCEEADDGKWYKTWHVVVDEKTHQPVEQAPTLMCGEGDKKEANTWGKQDRMDDCNFMKGGDTQTYYNRMFYLDREKSGHPASARLIHVFSIECVLYGICSHVCSHVFSRSPGFGSPHSQPHARGQEARGQVEALVSRRRRRLRGAGRIR